MKKKSFLHENDALVLAIFALVVFLGALLLWQAKYKHAYFIHTAVVSVDGWTTYADAKYGYKISYPKDWQTQTHQTPANAISEYNVQAPDNSHTLAVAVYSLADLKQNIDPSAWITYDPNAQHWVAEGCTDPKAGCKNITKTVVDSNSVIDGLDSYLIKDQDPALYLVPLRNNYGLVVSIGQNGNAVAGLDPVSQKIINSLSSEGH